MHLLIVEAGDIAEAGGDGLPLVARQIGERIGLQKREIAQAGIAEVAQVGKRALADDRHHPQ